MAEKKKPGEGSWVIEESCRALFEMSPDPILVCDLQGTILMVNGITAQDFGLGSPEEFISRFGNISDLMDADDGRRARERIGNLLADREAPKNEYTFVTPDGRRLVGEVSSRILHGPGGGQTVIFSVIHNITERKTAERRLLESEERYRTLFENMSQGAFYQMRDGELIDANPAALEMFGITLEELMARTSEHEQWDVISEDGTPVSPSEHPSMRALATGKAVREACLGVFNPRKGGYVWVALDAIPQFREGESSPYRVFVTMHDVTDRRAAAQALLESERKYRFLTEKMSDIVWTTDSNFKITYISPSVEKLLGFTPEERMAQDPADMMTPESLAHALELFGEELGREETLGREEGRAVVFDLEFTHKNGSTVWAENVASFIHDDSGRVAGIYAVTRDITEKRKAAELLRLSEQKFESAFQSSPDPMVISDLETGTIVDANSSFLAWAGFSLDEVIGKSPVELGLWVDPGARLRVIRELLAGGQVNGFEVKLRTRAGKIRDIEFWARLLDIGGKQFIFTLAHDATEEKIAERKLKESEEHFHSLFSNMVEGVALHELVFDGQGNVADYRIIDVNPSFERITGLRRHEVAGKKATEAYGQPEAPYLEEYRRVVRSGAPSSMETFYEPMGIHFDISIVPWGKNGVATIFSDITARKKAEEELKKLASAIHQAAESIVITDPKGTIQYVNPAFEKITGYTREEAIGGNPRILRSGEQDEKFYQGLWGTITGGGTWTGRLVNRRKDGTLYHEDAAISPIRDDAGRIVNFVGVKRDVTREVNLEEQLLRAQKLEAIGTLAGGIAHDFNNILSIIIGYTELALDAIPGTDPAHGMASEILKAGMRAKELVKQILTFSRKMESKREPVRVQIIVKETVKLLSSTIPKNIAVKADIDPEAGPVNADPAKIHQIIMNLCTNAYQAMIPAGGKMVVSLDAVDLDPRLLVQVPSLKEGPHLRLVVKDTGCGMGEETLKRIFDPFFTTKEKGRGTGLGLAMVYGITAELGGAITVSSEPGRGSTFTVYLPLAAGAGEEKPENEAGETGAGKGKAHILLVDDEEAIVQFARILLEGLGYRVTAVSSSRDALVLFKANPPGFDLVITDYSMPEMNGVQLAGEILKARPGTPVILMTGYSEDVSRDTIRELGISSYVEKPFNRRAIGEAIRECLDR